MTQSATTLIGRKMTQSATTLIVASNRMYEFCVKLGEGYHYPTVVRAQDVWAGGNAYEALWELMVKHTDVIIATGDEGPTPGARHNERLAPITDEIYNRVLPTWIAMQARSLEMNCAFFSSVWVFGAHQRYASCATIPQPQSWFGRSMYISERVVLQINPRVFVLRLPWMYGPEFPESPPMQNHWSGPVRVEGAGVAYRRAALDSSQSGPIALASDVVAALHRTQYREGVHNVYPYKELSTETWLDFVSDNMNTEHAYEFSVGGQRACSFTPCDTSYYIDANSISGVARFFASLDSLPPVIKDDEFEKVGML